METLASDILAADRKLDNLFLKCACNVLNYVDICIADAPCYFYGKIMVLHATTKQCLSDCEHHEKQSFPFSVCVLYGENLRIRLSDLFVGP